MHAARIRGALSLVALAVAAACGSSEPSGPNASSPSAIVRVSGNGQVGLVGTSLSLPLIVKVTGTSGAPIKGATVTFAVTAGAATLSPTTATTDSSGQAKTQVTLGSAAGDVTITATVAGTSLVTTFVVTAGTSSVSLACSAGSPQTPAAGGVLPGVGGTGVCLSGGSSGADYAVVAFYANPDSSAVASFTVTSHGATALATASIAPSFDATSLSPIGELRTSNVQTSFDARLRQIARRELTPKIPAAQQWNRQRPSLSAIPANPAIGTIVTLNANGESACSNPINVAARVAAVSNLAIIVADTANPTGGFTDAEYASFATLFDTLVSPLDVQNFGQPSDVDKNGKTVIFFTKEVNKLTPRGANGVIGGFFFERDLFPKNDSLDLQGCAASNVAEMYYSMVPDPNAQFSDARKKTDVQNLTPSTLVHEFQHLINAGRRLYVNNADAFEDVWLNEGLSHIAEELLYYRVAHLAPRQNISASVIQADQTSVNNFNNYQGDNFGRYELFLGKPSQTSVYAGNDSLETRGATWNLLRYLADHRGSSDADTWTLLDNSKLTGQANIASVFGSNYMTQIRDWATSVFSDDITGNTDTRFLEPSWNMRSIFPRLVSGSGVPLNRFPLAIVPLSDAAPANLSVFAGGAAYLRFTVPAGSQASIDWSAGGLPVSPLMQFTVVRSR
ncbi:MAG TPA: hypothetical protein VGQ56_10590 [Gemmatimonadaceae bacterium]|nr:hypothetical protein [Gemmatimonadaceae bacterium]